MRKVGFYSARLETQICNEDVVHYAVACRSEYKAASHRAVVAERGKPKVQFQTAGIDMLAASACNYYSGVTQKEAEAFYTAWEDVIYDALYGEHYISYAINRIRTDP